MYQFEKVHPDFFKQLKKEYPILTALDLRLCAYLKVRMDNKEIAQVFNITIEAFKKSINRTKKKINTLLRVWLTAKVIAFGILKNQGHYVL